LKADTSVAARSVLAQARFFSGLDKAQLERVAALGQARSFQADTRIYTVGDAVDHFYVLADGMVRFTLGLSKRDTAAGDIIRRGDVFGWAALVEGHTQRIATAYCLTACEVVALDGTALTRLMESDARIGFGVMKKLAVLLTSELVALALG
jgi:CRP-like cAMP-binding protein